MAQDLSGIELQTYKTLYKHQGARITFCCDQVTYQGIVDVIIPDTRLVKLRHTKIVEGDKYLGNLRFHFRDISSFKVVESAETVNRYPKNEYLLKILRNNRPVQSSKIAKALYGDQLSEDEDLEDEKKEEKLVLELPESLEDKLPKNYVIIDVINEDFHEAVKCVLGEKIIGVSFHGPVISRFGKLIWVCISTGICSFLFDIQQLGKEAFEKGLQKIFENKSIKKIIHDCKFPADCLYHQYSTHLNNVFDTRLADFVVNRQQYNDVHDFYSFGTLECCLRSYVKLPQEFLFDRVTDESSLNQESFFSKRPVSNEYLYDLLKSVIYLKLLHEKLSKELFAPLDRPTGVYLSILARNSKQLIEDLGNDLFRPDSIPQCLLMNGIQTAGFEKPQKSKNISLKCMFINPSTGEVIQTKFDQAKNILTQNNRNKTSDKDNLENKSGGIIKTYLCNSVTAKKFIQGDEKNKLSDKVTLVSDFYDVSNDRKSSASNIFTKTLCNPGEIFNCGSSAKPSLRELDLIYHKLINKMHSNKLGGIVHVKPSVEYISKFSDRQSFCDTDLSCINRDIDLGETCENSDDFQDIWSKLRSEFLAGTSSTDYIQKKFLFIPG